MMPILLLRKRDVPTRSFSFMGGVLPEGLTFSRASSAWYFDSTGTLQQASSNNPRFDCDPATGVLKGLLIEEQRTNNIRNSVASGAAAGTPGTGPTYWSLWTNVSGLTRSITGLGTEYGMPYIDVRWYGTASSSNNCGITLEQTTANPSVKNDIWTVSSFVKLVDGSQTNVNGLNIAINEFNSTPSYLTGGGKSITLTSTLQRVSYTRTLTGDTTAYAQPLIQFSVSSGNSIDITIRVYQPQFEKDKTVTSPIVTSGSMVTRAADSLYTNSIPWFNASEGAFLAEAIIPGVDTENAYTVFFNDNSTNNAVCTSIETGTSKPKAFVTLSGTSNFSGVTLSAISAYSVFRQAMRYKSGNNYMAVNGAIDSAGGMGVSNVPSAIARLDLGNRPDGWRPLNGWLRQFRYWNRILTDAELVKVTQ